MAIADPVTATFAVDPASGIIANLRTQLGVPYRWGWETPGVGWDCSGLVQWAYAKAGITLPRTTAQQVNSGRPITASEARPGDLLFLREGPRREIGHVMVYIGGNQFLHAPQTGESVKITTLQGLDDTDYVWRRVIAANDQGAPADPANPNGPPAGWSGFGVPGVPSAGDIAGSIVHALFGWVPWARLGLFVVAGLLLLIGVWVLVHPAGTDAPAPATGGKR